MWCNTAKRDGSADEYSEKQYNAVWYCGSKVCSRALTSHPLLVPLLIVIVVVLAPIVLPTSAVQHTTPRWASKTQEQRIIQKLPLSSLPVL